MRQNCAKKNVADSEPLSVILRSMAAANSKAPNAGRPATLIDLPPLQALARRCNFEATISSEYQSLPCERIRADIRGQRDVG